MAQMFTPVDKSKAKGKGAPAPGVAVASPASGLPGMEGPTMGLPPPEGRLAKLRAKGAPAPDRRDEQEAERGLAGGPRA